MTKEDFAKARMKLGYTQRQFAELIGRHYVTVAYYETGRIAVPKTIELLVNLLLQQQGSSGNNDE